MSTMYAFKATHPDQLEEHPELYRTTDHPTLLHALTHHLHKSNLLECDDLRIEYSGCEQVVVYMDEYGWDSEVLRGWVVVY